MAWKPYTPEEARAVREANLEQMESQLTRRVDELVTGDQWLEAMRFAAQFRGRSFLNTLLIQVQHLNAYSEGRVPTPYPSYVAGRSDWRKLGRWPAKEQTGYLVRKPVVERYAATNPASGRWRKLGSREKPRPGETVREKMVNVTYGKVWDVSQTDGEPVPERPRPAVLVGAAPAGLWDGLAAEVGQQGFTLRNAPNVLALDGADGVTDYTTRETIIRADAEDAERVAVLAHEVGHILMHDPEAEGREPHRGIREVEAESAAAMVCAIYGLDSGPSSVPYVAGWASTVKDVEPAEVIRRTGERVRRIVLKLLDRLPEPVGGDGSPPPPSPTNEAPQTRTCAQQSRPAARPTLAETEAVRL